MIGFFQFAVRFGHFLFSWYCLTLQVGGYESQILACLTLAGKDHSLIPRSGGSIWGSGVPG